MWWLWFFNIIVAIVTWLISKLGFKNIKKLAIIPLGVVYIGMMLTSFGLFVYGVTLTVNSIFDLITNINDTNSTNSSSSVFKCFFYLLDAMGISDALQVGLSLIVSNVLAILTLQATMVGKNQVQAIIKLFKDL